MKQIAIQVRKASRNILKAVPALVVSSFVLISCNKNDDYIDTPNPPQIESSIIAGSGDLTTSLAQFRSLIGDSLNTTPGKTSGRREINWDGVPPNFTNSNNFPFDFFNSTDPAIGNGRKRGLVYANTGTSFRVDSMDFSEINQAYGTEFDPFSGKRTFAYLGTNVTEVFFKVPGTNNDASVKGFGLIFSDIDDPNSTTLEFFDGIRSLGVFKAPARSGATSFSFLGVFFPNEKVTKVRITAGNGVLGTNVQDVSNGRTTDLVVMDDFFYSEPLAN